MGATFKKESFKSRRHHVRIRNSWDTVGHLFDRLDYQENVKKIELWNKPMKKRKKKRGAEVLARVQKEMALPRMSKSARIAELESDAARVSQRPRTVMPGTVDKIIQFWTPRLRETAQISIKGEPRYRELRVENSLTDEHGDEVKLEKGAHVEVTVTAEAKPRLIEKF